MIFVGTCHKEEELLHNELLVLNHLIPDYQLRCDLIITCAEALESCKSRKEKYICIFEFSHRIVMFLLTQFLNFLKGHTIQMTGRMIPGRTQMKRTWLNIH
jgi:hypothetical protein